MRARLLVAAQADPHVPAAAITGSTAIDTDDAWSDIDLAFAVDDVAAALERWTARLYGEFAALHHWDLPVGPTVYRVFLLPDCLEVDIAFTPVADFAPRGPSWRMVFGDDVAPRPSAASSRQFDQLAGLAWHHLLHARICIERGKPWQAEWLIGGTREQVLALACLRFGHTTSYAKGTDLLPREVTAPLAATLVRALDEPELRRAHRAAAAALTAELELTDSALARRLRPMLTELTTDSRSGLAPPACGT